MKLRNCLKVQSVVKKNVISPSDWKEYFKYFIK